MQAAESPSAPAEQESAILIYQQGPVAVGGGGWGFYPLFYSFFVWLEALQFGLANWITTSAAETAGMDADSAAALPSVFWLCYTVARVGCAVFTAPNRCGRLRSEHLVTVGVVGLCVALAVLQFGFARVSHPFM